MKVLISFPDPDYNRVVEWGKARVPVAGERLVDPIPGVSSGGDWFVERVEWVLIPPHTLSRATLVLNFPGGPPR